MNKAPALLKGYGRGRGQATAGPSAANTQQNRGRGRRYNEPNKSKGNEATPPPPPPPTNPWHRKPPETGENGLNNNASERFQKASSEMQDSIQRHLQAAPEHFEDSDSSEEDLADNVLDTVFKGYSGTYGDGEVTEVTKAQEDLLHSFRSNTSACLVCIESIKKTDAIWCCQGCYCIFHIQCIQKWVREGVHQQNLKHDNIEALDIPWYCPKCRFEYKQKDCPIRYKCFCGQVEDPSFDPWLVPHSCGQTCGKELTPSCGHHCLLLCHPGPCPPCPKILKAPCHCQRSPAKMRRCFDKIWSCGQSCGRLLLCKQHYCQQACHEGDCPPCPKTSQQKCLCGQETNIRPCASPQWQCEKICGKLLPCGHHTCEQMCHASSCGDCPRSGFRKCPCGKTSLQLPCTKDIPTCGDTCSKELSCGVHQCQQRCHNGQCDICRQTIVKKCRCAQRRKEVPCCKDYICDLKCQKMRDCGRHQCKRKCCEGNCPICEQVCARSLACRNHKCQSKCHQGPCYPCTMTVDKFCFCKSTYITVPCGREKAIKPPKCNQTCRIPSDCHHSDRKPHRCHFGDCPPCKNLCSNKLPNCPHLCPLPCHDAIKVKMPINPLMYSSKHKIVEQFEKIKKPCLPCQVPVEKKCFGQHAVNEFACSAAVPYSCRRPCNRLLPCTNHTCVLECHQVKNAADEKSSGSNCSKCEEGCTKERLPGCNHECLSPCHPGDCPPCSEIIRMRCHCRNILKYIQCYKWTTADTDSQSVLKSCGLDCLKVMPCQHKCPMVCHPGECCPNGCEKKKSLRCPCKRRKKEFICSMVTSGKAQVKCDEVCKEIQLKQKQIQEEAAKKKQEEEEKQQRMEFEDFERKTKRIGRKRRNRVYEEKTEPSFMEKHGKVVVSVGIAVVAVVVGIVFLYT
ncbi:gem-associated protein 5-like [Argonauta hians]